MARIPYLYRKLLSLGVPADVAAQIADTTYSGGSVGSGGGSVSPEQVKEIMSEALAAGDGIQITELPEEIQISSTVAATTVIRPWLPADLIYTQVFDAGVPSWVTQGGTATGGANLPTSVAMSSTGGASKPSYTNALYIPFSSSAVNGSRNTITFTLQSITAVAGKVPSEVRFWRSFTRGTGALNGAVQVNGTDRFTQADPGAAGSTAWVQDTYTASQVNTVAFTNQRTSTSPGTGAGWYVAGFEVYAQSIPWMLNAVAAYNAKLWRSTMDNNPNIPGGTGWVEV